MLPIALLKTPFLRQEGRFQHARRACSASLLGLFDQLKDHVLGLRRAKNVYIKTKSRFRE